MHTYTFYSFYYQWRVARQWCRFCTAIQLLFWLEFFTLIPTWSQIQKPGLSTVLNLLLSFLLPVIGWYFIKPFLKEAQKIAPLQKRLRKFTYKRKLFQKALLDQPRQDLLDEAHTIILGNVEAENTVTIVTNPFCQPCAKAHQLFDQWLSEMDVFKLQIGFASQNNEAENKTQVASHFQQLYLENKERAFEVVHNWYEGRYKTLKDLVKAYPVKSPAAYCEALEQQNNWCRQVGVVSTPTIFLNGYRIPEPWQYEDIKYFLY